MENENKYKEEILYDIPAHLKEYHSIVFDHEENVYRIYGHKYDEVGFKPYYIGDIKMSELKIKTNHKGKIVDLELMNHGMLITIYPLSMSVYLFEPWK